MSELIIVQNLEMYPCCDNIMWPLHLHQEPEEEHQHTTTNMASLRNNHVKYEEIEHAGPPAAPLEFPMPLIHRAQRLSVSVTDHVSGRVYHEKEVVAMQVRPQRAYLLKKRLAPCTFGVVRLAVVLERNMKQEETRECTEDAEWRSTSDLVAIKVVSTELVRQNLSSHSSNPLNEVASLQLVGSYHPNVLGCIEVLQNDEELYIVTPYKHGRDLYQKLKSIEPAPYSSEQSQYVPRPLKRANEECAREWFHDLLQGLSHLQNKGICHRNLSLDNLLLDSEGKLVIADFGKSLRVPYTDWSNFGGVTDVSEGSMRRLIVPQKRGENTAYLAPELLKSRAPFDGFAVDMWSAGVILFNMLVGRAPFRLAHPSDSKFVAISRKGQLRSILQALNIDISSDAVDLLQKLLWQDPHRRLTLEEALAHPWVAPDTGSENESCSVRSSSVQSSTVEESKASKCVRFSPSSVCEEMNCRLITFSEESLCHLSLGRMSSF